MMTVDSFISNNFISIFGLFLLLIILLNNENLSRAEVLNFMVLRTIEIIELVVFNLELWAASWAAPSDWRILFSAIGYTMRPLMVYAFLRILMYGKWRHSTWLVIMIPQFIATICAFSAFFTDICYSYNSYNEFIRGPLGYIFHWVAIFYMVLMGYCILRHRIMATRGENNAMISILLCMGVAMGIEVLAPEINNLVRSAMVFSTIATVYSFQASKLNREMAAIKENEKLRAELGEVLEEKLRSERENSSFLSHMSRDIRAPLNAILSLVDINEKSRDEKVIKENRDKVKDAAKHLQNLVTSVVEINKLDDGEIELENEPFDIRELTEDVLREAATSAKDAGLKVDLKGYEREFKCPYVYGSSTHVRQIIMNIMDNCIKFNKPGGQVGCQVTRLKIEDGKVWYQYLIWDTGRGMNREFLDKIFEPFSQEHAGNQDEYGGAGLGLYIAKTLVDMMDGTIEVTSKIGEGSNFVVILPFKISSRDAALSRKRALDSQRKLFDKQDRS